MPYNIFSILILNSFLDILIVLAKLLITLSFGSAKLNKIILFNKHAKINRKKMSEYSSDARMVDMI